MNGRDFRAALGEADRALEKYGLPPAADRRLRDRLAARGRGDDRAPEARRLWPLGLVAACAGIAAGVLVGSSWLGQRAPASLATGPVPTEAGGLLVQAPSHDLAFAGAPPSGDSAVEIVRGQCTLIDRASGSSLAVSGPVRVIKEPHGIRIVRGRVAVAVKKRPAGAAPARVLVSHGAIEVLGTRFTVEQRDEGGTVSLHEGTIRFVTARGAFVALEAGESLSWPLAEPGASALLPRSQSKTPAGGERMKPAVTNRSLPVEELLQRIATLRSRALFEEAARDLSAALARKADYPAAARERLSYELGSLLTHQISDRARACAHWHAHTQTFGRGQPRYDREVKQAEETIGCRTDR
jgi:transmembrane sensor